MTASSPSPPAWDGPARVIEPPGRWPALKLGELAGHADLLYFLTWRDVKVRYKQAALGVAWAVLQPVILMAIFSLVLGRFLGVPSDGLPYPAFVFIGLVPWTYFASAVTSASDSLVRSSDLIAKVYFPRLLVPLAALASYLPDLGIGLVLLGVILVLSGVPLAPTALLVPVFLAFAVLAATSISVWLSALNVSYRDVRYAVPFLVQIGLFATPVLYPASLIPERFHPVYALNPMAGVVEGLRWSLTGVGEAPWTLLTVSGVALLVLLLTGLLYFRRAEQSFADVI